MNNITIHDLFVHFYQEFLNNVYIYLFPALLEQYVPFHIEMGDNSNHMKLAFLLLFPAVIIVLFAYLVVYDQDKQSLLKQQLSEDQLEHIESLGTLPPDHQTIKSYMDDQQLMQQMGTLFRAHCAECHGILGTGQSGPNLCDDYYLTVTTLPSIYTAITEGNPSNGMAPHALELTNNQRVLLSSFVGNLRGSATSGKQAQGSRIPPWN